MNEQEALRILSNEFNQHWESGETPKSRVKEFKRRDFFALRDQLGTEKITSIVGPRRVGKTTIMFQLIDHLIKEMKVAPKRVLYVSMDNDYLIKSTDEPLKDMIDIYARYVLGESPDKLKSKVFIFLDEIQYLGDWQKKLKSWFDYKYDIKFVVSGSSSVIIQKGMGHLIGRISEKIVLPLKFVDFLEYNAGANREYHKLGTRLRDGLKLSIMKKDAKFLWKGIKALSYDIANKEREMEINLKKFMIKGGYPELLPIEDYDACSRELKDTIFSKTILDIVERYKVRNIGVLRYLFAVAASRSGSKLTYTGLSSDLGVERPTIISHLDYLEDAFLLSKSGFFTKSVVKRARKEKKVYVNDVGMRNSVVGSMSESLLKNPAEMGVVAETIVFDHTKRLRFFLSGRQAAELFYWSNNGSEIDIVLECNGVPVPIEVKYRENPGSAQIKTLQAFVRKHKSPFGIVVTKNTLGLKDNILYLPLRLYLLMC